MLVQLSSILTNFLLYFLFNIIKAPLCRFFKTKGCFCCFLFDNLSSVFIVRRQMSLYGASVALFEKANGVSMPCSGG